MKKRFLFSPDEPSGTAGGENEPEGTEPEGTEPEGTPPAGSEGPGGQGDTVPRSEFSKVTREAAKYRRELRTVQEQLKEREDQDKSELERERDRAVRAEGESKSLKQANRELRVQVLASKVGIVREAQSDAARLLDWDSLTDPDDPREVETALRDLTKEKPYLLGNVPGGSDAGAGGERGGQSQNMNDLLRQAAGRT